MMPLELSAKRRSHGHRMKNKRSHTDAEMHSFSRQRAALASKNSLRWLEWLNIWLPGIKCKVYLLPFKSLVSKQTSNIVWILFQQSKSEFKKKRINIPNHHHHYDLCIAEFLTSLWNVIWMDKVDYIFYQHVLHLVCSYNAVGASGGGMLLVCWSVSHLHCMPTCCVVAVTLFWFSFFQCLVFFILWWFDMFYVLNNGTWMLRDIVCWCWSATTFLMLLSFVSVELLW